MYRSQLIVLACAIALTVGCAQNKTAKHAKRDWKAPTETTTATANANASATTQPSADTGSAGTTVAAAPTTAPSVDHPLAGAWSLAMPRHNQQSASITAKDGDHITIKAGENLSGEYVVQGSYLLILTQDAKLRPLAWRINTNDSLTVVRSPDLGEGAPNYTGVTLVRAASEISQSDTTQSQDAAASADTQEVSNP